LVLRSYLSVRFCSMPQPSSPHAVRATRAPEPASARQPSRDQGEPSIEPDPGLGATWSLSADLAPSPQQDQAPDLSVWTAWVWWVKLQLDGAQAAGLARRQRRPSSPVADEPSRWTAREASCARLQV